MTLDLGGAAASKEGQPGADRRADGRHRIVSGREESWAVARRAGLAVGSRRCCAALACRVREGACISPTGRDAFQAAFRLHLHVQPRTADDGFRIKAARRRPGRVELDLAAWKVRQGMHVMAG